MNKLQGLLSKILFTLVISLPLTGHANQDATFSTVMPGWSYQPKQTASTLENLDVFEFRGLLNKNGKDFVPSMFVLKQPMPNNKTVDHLEMFLNKKYFKNKASLKQKTPLTSSNGYRTQTYIFTTKEKGQVFVTLVYAYQVKKDLILLSQTSRPNNYKNDYKVTATALNHIKFID
ncbi:MAG: hypothetical protein M9899_02225 [Bdellovibrionaceae bacterium]|nr:hypothetical protein [Pseudobdellovibrionaceae bacterium]